LLALIGWKKMVPLNLPGAGNKLAGICSREIQYFIFPAEFCRLLPGGQHLLPGKLTENASTYQNSVKTYRKISRESAIWLPKTFGGFGRQKKHG